MNGKKVKVCVRCVMDNSSDDTIHFNEKGHCNYCEDVLKRKDFEYFPNEKGEKQLNEIFKKIKKEGENKKYHCIVGLSGGIDSSFIIYLGYKYKLKMLAVHIDDGLDTEITKDNLKKLVNTTNTDLINIKPCMREYKDAILSFFKAGLPNTAIIQDNLIFSELNKIAKENKIKYMLSGANFATESILQRGCTHNAFDKAHIKDVEKNYATISWKHLNLIGYFRRYIIDNFNYSCKKFYPLNYIKYDVQLAIDQLNNFCGYNYYGGKHYESILTRFIQCYYLPVKFNFDKRKSHYSSMIISNQMSREKAIEQLKINPYLNSELYESDIKFLSDYFNLSIHEFKELMDIPKHNHKDYKVSSLNRLANIARKFRKIIN